MHEVSVVAQGRRAENRSVCTRQHASLPHRPSPARFSGFDRISPAWILLDTLPENRNGWGVGVGCPPVPVPLSFSTELLDLAAGEAELKPQRGGLNKQLPTGRVDPGWGHLSRSQGGERLVIVCPNIHLPICLYNRAPMLLGCSTAQLKDYISQPALQLELAM